MDKGVRIGNTTQNTSCSDIVDPASRFIMIMAGKLVHNVAINKVCFIEYALGTFGQLSDVKYLRHIAGGFTSINYRSLNI